MADIWVKVLTPADSYALLTLDELKAILNVPLTDTSEDAQLQMLIDQYSDVVATMCNRVFAYETVEETWRCSDSPRLFLTRYQVADADLVSVESPRGSVLDPTIYELENTSGKLRIEGAWAEPVTVTYSGGYQLPDAAPQSLKAATGMLIQGARMQGRTTSGIQSVTHGDTRVQYFDPSQASKAGSGADVGGLLYKYMRLYV
jgi:hypothetical protein